jgi:hypothetical protein
MNIYLDIDGVLIDKKGKPFPRLEEFIKWLIDKHDVYWLTTWVKDGNSEKAVAKLNKFVAEKYLKKIKPTIWNSWKTEAIDMRKPFVWIDDIVFPQEEKILKENNVEDRLFLIHPGNDNHFEQLEKSWALSGPSTFNRLQEEYIKTLNSKRNCTCEEPLCAKCLMVNCIDDNCKIHSIKNKISRKIYFLNNIKDKEKLESQKKEIQRLKNIQKNETTR